jgi:hypothetical protein
MLVTCEAGKGKSTYTSKPSQHLNLREIKKRVLFSYPKPDKTVFELDCTSVLLYNIALLLINNNTLIMLSPTIIGGERGKKLLLISPVSNLGNVRGSISYGYISEITHNYQA